MLLAVAFVLLKSQVLGPVLPPDCSAQFQKAFFSVEEALQSQNFDKASKLIQLLPKKEVTISWIDEKVPASFRAGFQQAGERALAMFATRIKGSTFKFAPHGVIQISFEPVLAKRPGTNFPAARVGFFSENPSEPRLDFVIGLKRGNPLQVSEEVDVFNDVCYCLGSYLGIADGASPEDVMGTTDLKRIDPVKLSVTERTAAIRNLSAVSSLETAIKNRVSLAVTKPGLFIDPVEIEGEPAIQGDRVEFHVQLSNSGNAPLSYSFSPDCGCTAVTAPGTIEPQSGRMAQFAVDTRAFSTNITKHVTVYSNDPETPSKVITLHVKVKPRYRLIVPLGYSVTVPSEGMKYPIYFIPEPNSSLDPVSNSFNGPGVVAKVTSEKWQGVLADPERNEGPLPRKGFKFIVDIKGKMLHGKNPCSFQVFTANPLFPDITLNFSAQSGIVAEPAYLNLGEVGRVPTSARILISKPGKAFQITGVSCTSPHFQGQAKPGDSPGEYILIVQYDGKGDHGVLSADLKVKTNDPKQPVIEIPCMASIR